MADLLLVDGNPLENLDLIADPDAHHHEGWPHLQEHAAAVAANPTAPDSDRVAIARASEPFARPPWKIGVALYERLEWIHDRLVCE